ncbi:hypothetical protein KBX50_12085 [Micromonospora sp. C51]|uniref:hypothetical protein n=1 Tax=Micromonospora sp. C51 TaxID=2824879 RepID=UPI001B35C918|nr:hypothetical protein [Micromonospora sp. C51]MBQ1049198.1 hypothetical protein [Micromonospora sp. C51]
MTDPPLRAPAENHRALHTYDLTGRRPADGTRAMAGTNPLTPGAPATPPACQPPPRPLVRAPGARACDTRAATLADAVQVAWTSAQHIAADVAERH